MLRARTLLVGLGIVALAVTLPAPAQAAPAAETSYSFTSEAGDFVGAGRSAGYTAPAATITVRGDAGFLTVAVRQGEDWWYLDLAAPRGDTLRPGRYVDAERAAFRTGRAPGLDVYGNGRGCNKVWGEFWVDQIATDASGAVTLLDARLTQRCENDTAPELDAVVRFNAFPLSYTTASEPGDWVGGGVTKSYLNGDSVFGLQGSARRVTFTVSGQRDDWDVTFAAPQGQSLAVGTYTGAQRYPFQPADRPGLDASGNGRGCNALSGEFTITEIEFDTAGAVRALSATFVQHCDGAVPALRGSIHYFA